MVRKFACLFGLATLFSLAAFAPVQAQSPTPSAPVITFSVPDGASVSPTTVAAYGVKGLAIISFQANSAIPIKFASATGFWQGMSSFFSPTTHISGSLFWYTPVYAAG